jgi:hypothetical protein
MVKVITNNHGSGDWVIIQRGDEKLFEGHKVSTFDLASILEELGHTVTMSCLTDEEMKEGNY